MRLSQQEIEEIARQKGISPSMVNAVINAESSGNPNAVSSKGAQGLMQVMPATGAEVAKKLGYPSNYDITDPKTNVNIGSQYLADMMAKYKGNEKLALAAYNSGPGTVDGLVAKYGSDYEKIQPHLYKETQDYVPKVQGDSDPTGNKALMGAAKKQGQNYLESEGKEALLGNAASAGTNAFSATANGATMFSGGSTVGGSAVGSAANGGTLMSTGEVVGAGAGEAMGSTGAAQAAGGIGLGQVLGVAGAAYGGYQTAKMIGDDPSGGKRNKKAMMGGAASGASLGTAIMPGWGTAIGAAAGAAIGFAGSEFGSNKDKDQMARDAVRKSMAEQKIFAPGSYELIRADGSGYDIGRDGAAKILNSDGKTSRQAFDVDFKNPLAAETTAQSMALGMILTGGHKKLSDDYSGYITNAALSNAKDQTTATQNLQAITKQMMGSGLTQESAKAILDKIKGNLDPDAYNVAVSKLPILFGNSQPITKAGADAQKKGGGIVEGPPMTPIAPVGQRPTTANLAGKLSSENAEALKQSPALSGAIKNKWTAPTQSPTGAFRSSPQSAAAK